MQISALSGKAAAVSVACLLFAAGSQRLVADEQPTAAQIKFFESKVRPLLAAKCFKCHGAKKQNGDLRLDSLGGMLQGGESGEAIVPGKPGESLLIEAIRYESFEMPPSGKLDEPSIAILTKWVTMGAPWPGGDKNAPPKVIKTRGFSDEDRAFWSFQAVKNPSVPVIDDPRWSKNPIDAFVYRKLKEQGLSPAPEADRLTLIRRAYFDLIGLPPSSEEIDAFLADDSSDADAFKTLVDQLLKRPQYGERWGRHWLALVRYSDSDGFNQDAFRPHIWQYRDYVVRAFNTDKPYAQRCCPDGKTLLDVGGGGGHGCRFLESFKDFERTSVELPTEGHTLEDVRLVHEDFLNWKADRKYDLVLCMQVLEHISDVVTFTRKLFDCGSVVIISVPYRWPAGEHDGHIHDPVDELVLKKWTDRDPIETSVIDRRLVCAYDAR